jgi:hypothetical protein
LSIFFPPFPDLEENEQENPECVVRSNTDDPASFEALSRRIDGEDPPLICSSGFFFLHVIIYLFIYLFSDLDEKLSTILVWYTLSLTQTNSKIFQDNQKQILEGIQAISAAP